MTPDVLIFFLRNKDRIRGRVLEVGSLDVNGSLKLVFPDSIGTDMREGKGVDVVCSAEDLPERFGPESFDTVISAETLEHVERWREAIRGIWTVLKPEGWFVVTMASVKKGRHAYPDDYWRMLPEHILQVFPGAVNIQPEIGRISIGWAVQKIGDLPDLDAIELIPVP